jgi:transposase
MVALAGVAEHLLPAADDTLGPLAGHAGGRTRRWSSAGPGSGTGRAGRHHLCAARRRALALLPARELGCGSGVTCWRRLRDCQAAGVWEALHHRLLDWLGDDGQVDWSRASIDSVSVRARRGDLVGANPVDRGKRGSKYHLLIDAGGIPLAVGSSAANTHDSQLLEPMLDAVPAVIGPQGRPGRHTATTGQAAWRLGLRLPYKP